MTHNEVSHQMSIMPILQEIQLAIKEINICKALGIDGIPMELLHFGGHFVASAVFDLITPVWEGTPVLQDGINGVLVSIFKSKDLKSVCGSY